eukprot:m.56682 g.56682  ORF g.56682 m.56682 type:complete len:364 (-) comp12646_c0_seq2:39-1130(-)
MSAVVLSRTVAAAQRLAVTTAHRLTSSRVLLLLRLPRQLFGTTTVLGAPAIHGTKSVRKTWQRQAQMAAGTGLVLVGLAAATTTAACREDGGDPGGDGSTASAFPTANTSADAPDVASPFVYPELTEGLERRQLSQTQLLQYGEKMRAAQEEIEQLYQADRKTLGEPEATRQRNIRMVKFKDIAMREIQRILYGIDDPGARQRYLDQYGCARWTDAALAVVASHSPLVEIGAGPGHWQAALSKQGADIVAFDDRSERQATDLIVGKVAPGNENKVTEFSDRTLFLCYPPNTDMATNCLKLYKGSTLVYVGEGRGGVNGTPEFFDELEQHWTVIHIEPLEPFAECFEKLFVLKREPQRSWWSWW